MRTAACAAKVRDPGPLESGVPRLGADLTDWPPVEAEHVSRMLPALPPQNQHRFRIERGRDSLTCFGLIGMNPVGGARRS